MLLPELLLLLLLCEMVCWGVGGVVCSCVVWCLLLAEHNLLEFC
jgi:hypothetical protein